VRECGGGRGGGEKTKGASATLNAADASGDRPPGDGGPGNDTAGNSSPTTGASTARKRPKVANTVARIEQGSKKRFTFSGSSLGQVLRFVLAFLLTNDLLGGRIHLFTDGYKSLQHPILAFFAWHPRVWLLLDGYHLVKKFKEELSLACRGRTLRNQHLRLLVRYLWYGLVTEAQQ
jgi:hypothetical protein